MNSIVSDDGDDDDNDDGDDDDNNNNDDNNDDDDDGGGDDNNNYNDDDNTDGDISLYGGGDVFLVVPFDQEHDGGRVGGTSPWVRVRGWSGVGDREG
jgi:hypothetical protein